MKVQKLDDYFGDRAKNSQTTWFVCYCLGVIEIPFRLSTLVILGSVFSAANAAAFAKLVLSSHLYFILKATRMVWVSMQAAKETKHSGAKWLGFVPLQASVIGGRACV